MDIKVLVFLFSLIFSIVIIQSAFAEEDPTIISVKIIGEPEIYLDLNNKMIRAEVEIENYTPSDGYYFMQISNSSEIIKETEIYPSDKGNDLWGVQVAYMVTSEIPDAFTILIFSETGTATATTTFSSLETKLSVQQAVKEEANETKPIVQQAVKEEANESKPVLEPEVIEDLKQELPDWVRNIFIWYAEEEIGEEELIGALQFLITEGIIQV